VSNLDLILTIYEYLGTGQMGRMRAELLRPDVAWVVPGHNPLAGTHRGGAAAVAFLDQVARAGIRFDQMHFGELDDGTVVERHLDRVTLGNQAIQLPSTTAYRVVDGRVAEVQVYSGDQHTLDRYLWAVAALKPITDRIAPNDSEAGR
jgi:uncharacterized protein